MAADVQSLAQGQQAPPQDAPASGAAAAANAGSQQNQTARPEWVPENFWDAEKASIKLDDLGKDYAANATIAKAELERRAAFPQKIEDFKLAFPEDLKGPDGKPLQVDMENPDVQAFRQFAFDNKVDQKQANAILGLYAKNELAKTDRINKRVAEEKTKLGANVAARIDAVTKGLGAHLNEHQTKALTNGLFTADQVSGLESLLQKITTQGAAQTNGASLHSDPPPPATVEQRWYGQQKG